MRFIRLLLCALFLLNCANALAEDGNSPLTLDDCVEQMLVNNPYLDIARTDIVEKEASLRGAKKDLLPALSFQYGYTNDPDANLITSIENYYNYSFTVSQPLYQGGALKAAVDLGKKTLEYSEISLSKALNDTVKQVHDAYFNVLKAQKLNEVTSQALRRLELHSRDARAFYEVGLIPKNDLLTSEVQLAQGQQDLLASEDNLALAKSTLNLLMSRSVDEALEIVDVMTYEARETSWDELVELARSQRPEIIQGSIAMEQAEKNVDLAKATYLPSLTISASYQKQGDTVAADSYPLGNSEVKKTQATLTWQLWSWGQTRDNVAVARQKHRKAKDARALAVDSVMLDVRRAWLNLRQTEKNIDVTRKAVEQAEENYRINEARYKAQLNTSTEVLDAQTLLTGARTNYYNALYDYKIAKMSLDWATGALGSNYN